MKPRVTRREFLAASAAIAVTAALPASAQRGRGKDKLNIGVIGVYNRGRDNLDAVSGQNIVALCDVDKKLRESAAPKFPSAKLHVDFREMIEREDLDAVVVATPDHMHAPAALYAMNKGLHVYCEKPLAHSVYEVRKMAETARKKRLVTQMGTQIHATVNYRRVVELVQSGVIGPVREVHCWVDRQWSGGDRPKDTPPIPAGLHWDLWLGPAPERPYNPAYHPFNWRRWWDFGGGTLGDMGCHHMDLPYWALNLGHPLSVYAEGPEPNSDSTPGWLIVRYEHPARGAQPPVTLTWRHGGKRPEYFAEGTLPSWGDGTLFVGEKGMLLADYGRYLLLPEKDFANITRPTPSIPESIGHHNEWIEAIKNGGTPLCNFDYASVLTEAVLLGNVSYRVGKKLEWDPKRLRASNCSEADSLIKPTFRKGWEL